MFLRITRLILLAVLLFGGAITQSPAQQAAWQKIAPAGEAFTVSMPTMVVEAVVKNVEVSHEARVETWARAMRLLPFCEQ